MQWLHFYQLFESQSHFAKSVDFQQPLLNENWRPWHWSFQIFFFFCFLSFFSFLFWSGAIVPQFQSCLIQKNSASDSSAQSSYQSWKQCWCTCLLSGDCNKLGKMVVLSLSTWLSWWHIFFFFFTHLEFVCSTPALGAVLRGCSWWKGDFLISHCLILQGSLGSFHEVVVWVSSLNKVSETSCKKKAQLLCCTERKYCTHMGCCTRLFLSECNEWN